MRVYEHNNSINGIRKPSSNSTSNYRDCGRRVLHLYCGISLSKVMNLQQHLQVEREAIFKELAMRREEWMLDDTDLRSWDQIEQMVTAASQARTIVFIREAVKELGHQQEDGSIWCDMDAVLEILK